jgi:hypothetical protein
LIVVHHSRRVFSARRERAQKDGKRSARDDFSLAFQL